MLRIKSLYKDSRDSLGRYAAAASCISICFSILVFASYFYSIYVGVSLSCSLIALFFASRKFQTYPNNYTKARRLCELSAMNFIVAAIFLAVVVL